MNPIVPVILTTERLILRPPAPEDADPIELFARERRAAEATALIPYPYPVGGAQEWLARADRAWEEGWLAAFMICLQETGELVGSISLARSPDGELDLGYWIGLPNWGQGYATEALRRILDYAFDDLGADHLHTWHFSHNPASGRVMQKAGLRFLGIDSSGGRRRDQRFEAVRYGISAAEWHAGHPPQMRLLCA